MKKILFITDEFNTLKVDKDTSIFFMEEYIKKKDTVYCCEIVDIFLDSEVSVIAKSVSIQKDILKLNNESLIFNLLDFDIIFMRKDPPVNELYIHALHLLGLAEKNGANIINSPSSLLMFNEKILATYFKDFIPNTLITSKQKDLEIFFQKHKKIIVKPINGMGGDSIHMITKLEETEIQTLRIMTDNFTKKIIAQVFLEEIYNGDYRVLVINGKPFDIALARIPAKGNFKGNLAAGGIGEARKITDAQKDISKIVGKFLTANGISFAGLDFIGNKLTEINITSPTCAREIYNQTGKNPILEFINNN